MSTLTPAMQKAQQSQANTEPEISAEEQELLDADLHYLKNRARIERQRVERAHDAEIKANRGNWGNAI